MKIVSYELEERNDSICLKLIDHQKSRCAIAFVGIMGLIMLLMPIFTMIILSVKISFGSLLICIVAWMISGYFIRLYLWNRYGEEVFVFYNNRLEKYNDFKFYKENHKFYDFIRIEVAFTTKDHIFYFDETIDNEMFLNKNGNLLSQVGFILDGNLIESHRELAISDIIYIAKRIISSNVSY